VEWLVEGKVSGLNAAQTSFSFDSTGRYIFDYNGNIESGTYKVENDMLFTTPDKQREIMVKIARLTTDTLIFEMNRSGKPELLSLLRKK